MFYLFVTGLLLSGLFVANGQKCFGDQLINPDLVKSYSEGNLDFAFNLFKNAANGTENAFISPFSTSVALAMTSAGAGGNTLSQMINTLRLNNLTDAGNVHRAFHSMVTSVCSTADYELYTANKMYAQKELAIETPFLVTAAEVYESSVEKADFKGRAEQEALSINAWVEKQTQNNIRGMFPPGSLDPSIVLMLVNAVYFKGSWQTKFPKTETKARDFELRTGRNVSIPMMSLFSKLNYTESQRLRSQAIKLPYQGGRMAMYVILPTEVDGLDRLKKRLSAEAFRALMDEMSVGEAGVMVKLPKFKLNFQQNLGSALWTMGMADLFDREKANLRGIATPAAGNLFVSGVMHQAVVSVDEDGTTAAAVTSLLVPLSADYSPVTFTADHPFVFVIYDELTQLVLFIGSVDDPSK